MAEQEVYLLLRAPIQPAHRIGATKDNGDHVILKVDAILGRMVLACGSSIDIDDYRGRCAFIQK